MKKFLACAALATLLFAGRAEAAATNFVGPIQTYACAAHTWANSLASATAATTCTQPAVGDLATVAGGTVLGNNTGSNAAPIATAAPVLGIVSTTAGSLGFASSSTANLVTVQQVGATAAYNFNLPNTVGTAGQVLTSQAGGSTAMTWSSVITSNFTVVSKTGGYTIASAGADDWKRFDNSGGGATQIVFTLPTTGNLAAGDNWCFLVASGTTGGVEVLAAATETITYGNVTGAAAGNLQATTVGSSVCIYMESTTAAYAWANNGAWQLN